MDVLVCLANYGDGQLDCLHRVIEGYCSFSSRFRVYVILDTTVPVEVSPYRDRLHVVPFFFKPGIRHGLAFVHRQHMVEHQDNYDLFIYSENDILIQERNVDAYLRVSERLPDDYLSGFLRYETVEGDGELYLIDMHPHSPVLRDRELEINGYRYFSIHNLHQGSWILTRQQLKRAIRSGGFAVMPHYMESRYGVVGILESGASDVYMQCGFKNKVFPYDGVDDLLIHHLPNKYVRLGGVWEDPGPMTLGELKQVLGIGGTGSGGREDAALLRTSSTGGPAGRSGRNRTGGE